MYKLNILSKADEDYYNSLNWYAAQQSDLPGKFAVAIRSVFDIILKIPKVSQKIIKVTGKCQPKYFPI